MIESRKLIDEVDIDLILNSVLFSCKELYDIVWDIPHERIFETGQIIDDAISQLMIAKCKLDGRKL